MRKENKRSLNKTSGSSEQEALDTANARLRQNAAATPNLVRRVMEGEIEAKAKRRRTRESLKRRVSSADNLWQRFPVSAIRAPSLG